LIESWEKEAIAGKADEARVDAWLRRTEETVHTAASRSAAHWYPGLNIRGCRSPRADILMPG